MLVTNSDSSESYISWNPTRCTVSVLSGFLQHPRNQFNRPALEFFPEMLVPPQLPALVPSQQADDVVLDAGAG